MKIKKVIVDQIPDGCAGCVFARSDGIFLCAALQACFDGLPPYTFRRHDCPLETEKKTNVANR